MRIFKIIQVKDYNYLKIYVEGNGDNEKTNLVISYYQEEELKERKQLSQSVTNSNSTIMWLTKEQIQNDFYLTIECAKTPCDYKLDLNGQTTADIHINEQYTYFITKETQLMNFRLLNLKNAKTLNENYTYFLEIWAKGNMKINAKLEGGDYEKSPYTYYRIKYNDFIKSKYYFAINGTIDDFINIGILLYHTEKYDKAFHSDLFLEDGVEIAGYLYDNEKMYFKKTYAYSKGFF